MQIKRHAFLIMQELFGQILTERERWAYWLPVLIAIGIAVYFRLPVEPPLWLPVLLFTLSACVWFVWRRSERASYALVCVVAVMAGVLSASIRTYVIYTPMLDRNLGPVMIEANVDEREARENGSRLLLGDIKLERRTGIDVPKHIRLTLRSSMVPDPPPIGSRIRVLVNLLPMTEPSSPGGYDFRRQSFFDQVGASGIALRAPEILVAEARPVSLAEGWRDTVARRVSEVVGGAEGAIGIALMTGERGAIDERTNENMRMAGTSHLLSISGMHIGMVGGFIFFMVRSLLALLPAVALRYPVKKFAAVVALAAVVGYTWLVGSPIPAQRSMLMAGLVFVAVLLDRQVLSMRSVALAAGVILLLFPESLLNPGFQMSFSAIVMLIASYEWWRLNKPDNEERPGLWGRSWRYVAGIVITSLVAGFATMPYGAWHFHRLQLLGLLGNLIAVPLTGFVIMPALVLSYILLPFGWAKPALVVVGWGLSGVTSSAAWVASLPGADITAAQFSLLALLLITFGGLWLAIWQQWVRYLGLSLILAGTLLTPFHRMPIAIVSPEGQIAVRAPDGHLYYERPPRGLIARDWSRAFDSGREGQGWRDPVSGVRCDRTGCTAPYGIGIFKLQEAALEDCTRVKFAIAPDLRLRNCKAVVIDRAALRQHGAHAIYADGSVETSRSGSNRPWQPYYRGNLSYSGASARPDAPAP